MAKEVTRQGFTFYKSYFDVLSKIQDPLKRDELNMAICRYSFDGIKPDTFSEFWLEIAWDGIYPNLKSNREKYISGTTQKRSETEAKWKRNGSEMKQDVSNENKECFLEKKDAQKKQSKQTFPFLQRLIEEGVEETTANDFMTLRKCKGAVNSETAFKGLIRQAKLISEKECATFNTIIAYHAMKNWYGLHADLCIGKDEFKTFVSQLENKPVYDWTDEDERYVRNYIRQHDGYEDEFIKSYMRSHGKIK